VGRCLIALCVLVWGCFEHISGLELLGILVSVDSRDWLGILFGPSSIARSPSGFRWLNRSALFHGNIASCAPCLGLGMLGFNTVTTN
jgi:hypothetical protein